MKIAIDVSPLSSGHKVRGVGFYLQHLLEGLKKYHKENQYVEFTERSRIPSDADIIHYPYFDPFFVTLPIFPNKKIAVTIHDLTPLVLPHEFPIGIKGKVTWQIQKQLVKGVGGIITDSLCSKKDIERIIGIPDNAVDSIYLAAGDDFRVLSKRTILQVKKKYKLPESFVLYVGDGTANKNLPRLVKASLQTSLPLIMVGKSLLDESIDLSNPWTQDIKEVRKLAATYPDKIRLLGFVETDDLVALYNSATVFVMPSLYEGFGLPILEAFSSGCPVVTSDKGSLREVAWNAAIFIDPYDIDAIANAIKKVRDDSFLRSSLKQKGLKRAKEFSWKKTVDETIASYTKIITHER